MSVSDSKILTIIVLIAFLVLIAIFISNHKNDATPSVDVMLTTEEQQREEHLSTEQILAELQVRRAAVAATLDEAERYLRK